VGLERGAAELHSTDISADGTRFLSLVPSEPDPTVRPRSSVAPQIEVVEHWFEELKRVVPTK
jgi:hypothetical protein